MKNKRGAEIINSYNPRMEIKAGTIFYLALFLLLQAPIFLDPRKISSELLLASIPFLLIDAVLIWYTIILCTQTRLFVYENGLEFQHGQSYFFTTWDNLSHFGRLGNGNYSKYGIFLHDAVKPKVTGLVERLVWGWSSDFLLLDEVFYLPKRWRGVFQGAMLDLDKLWDSTFGQEVYQFAPHLFTSEIISVEK